MLPRGAHGDVVDYASVAEAEEIVPLEQTLQQLVHACVVAQDVVVDDAGHAGREAGRIDGIGLAGLLRGAEHQPGSQARDPGELGDRRRQLPHVAMQRADPPARRIGIRYAEHGLVLLEGAGEFAAADAGDGDEKRNGKIRHPERRPVRMPEPVADRGPQVQPQRPRQAVHARLRDEAEDLPVGEVLQDLRNPGQVESPLSGPEEPEDRSHRAASQHRGLKAGRLQQREGGEVYVSGAASAAADEHQVPLAHLPVEPLARKAVPELLRDLRQRFLSDPLRFPGSRQQLVRRGQQRPLRIQQRPEHLHQPLAEGAQDRRHGDVSPIRGAHVPAAAERERVPDRGLVTLVEPPTRRDRRARELRLHGGDGPDFRESFLQQRHGAP